MKQTISFSICKSSCSKIPWGFKIVGGLDYGSPITVKKVESESSAEKSGLKKNDVIRAVNDVELNGLRLDEAMVVVKSTGENFFLHVERLVTGEKEDQCFKRRYQIAILAFLGFANIYAMRVNLSVAIVAMTSNETVSNTKGVLTIIPAEFNWSPATQGLILSSFFYGYIGTQVLGGWFATRFGGKNIFGLGVFITALFTVLTPWFARTNVYLLVLARVVEGLFEGVTYPAIHAVWGRWAPPLERSRLSSLAISGGPFGTVISLPLCGIIAEQLGWPSIFYIFGVLGLLWVALWCFTVGNYPSEDRFISESERTFIESTVGKERNEKLTIPWKEMFCSIPVWGIVVAHFTENWGFYTLLTELPTYMNEKFHFDMHSTGLLSALPYLMMSITIPLGGSLADYLLKNGILTTTQVRRTFNFIAFLFQGIFLLIVAHSSSAAIVITSLTLALGFGGLSLSGFLVNPLDIGHQYAGIILGLSNTVATTPGIISPALTGYLVGSKATDGWKIVFYISIFIYIIGAVAYWFMASGDRQEWAKLKNEEHPLKEKNIHSDNMITDKCSPNSV